MPRLTDRSDFASEKAAIPIHTELCEDIEAGVRRRQFDLLYLDERDATQQPTDGLGGPGLQIVHFYVGFQHLLKMRIIVKSVKRYSVKWLLSANAEKSNSDEGMV